MNKWLQAMLGLSPAAVLRGIRSGPRAMARAALGSFRLASHDAIATGRLGIPEFALDVILGRRSVTVAINVMAHEDGMLPMRDALPLLSIAVAEQPESIVEIGTYMGHTARALAYNLPRTTIHTIDLPPEYSSADARAKESIPKDDFHLIAKRRVGREFIGTEYASRIVQHFADTAEMDFNPLAPASLFFIDGSHTYEYCKNDTEKCLSIARQGATFLWHDCDAQHPGVVKFLTEFRAQGHDVCLIAGSSLAYWRS